jgi:polar amino acid transport system substrate-binding protein
VLRAGAALALPLVLLVASCSSDGAKDTVPASEAAAATDAAAASEAPATEAAATEAMSSEAMAAMTEAAPPSAALTLINAGKITVCSDIPYAPFEYYENGAEGNVIGIDADLVGAIATANGVTADFIKTPFDGIFAALAAGKCDMIASSVSITDERKLQNDFSTGYFKIQQTILARSADAATLNDLPALKGKTVGAQAATTGADFSNKGSAANGYTVKEFQGADEMIAALKAGQVDVVIQDSPINGYAATQSNGELVVSKVFEGDGEEYGFVVPKGNPGLTAALNASLKKLQDSGEYKAVLKKYLGAAAG